MTDSGIFYPGERVLGKYQIERELGAGGMGQVFEATHLRLGTRVALKVLHPDMAEDATLIERFAREAHTASCIRSEHVARVLDIESLDDGYPLIVMEYLDGHDLSEHLNHEGPLPVGVATDYVLQACEAVAEAHKNGIVHRDLKPSNLFLTRRADGSELIKVMDFGIAKAVADAELDSLTLTQDIVGSPLYMSPEQLRSSKDVDHRTDIWSLGVILYELISGALPFNGPSSSAVLAAVAADAPIPIERYLSTPPEALVGIFQRCFEKNPDLRYANIAEFAQDLAQLAPESRISLDRVMRTIHGADSVHPPRSQSTATRGSAPTALSAPPSDPRSRSVSSTDQTIAAQTGAAMAAALTGSTQPNSVRDVSAAAPASSNRRGLVIAALALGGAVSGFVVWSSTTPEVASTDSIVSAESAAPNVQSVPSAAAAPEPHPETAVPSDNSPPPSAAAEQPAPSLSAAPNAAIPAPIPASTKPEQRQPAPSAPPAPTATKAPAPAAAAAPATSTSNRALIDLATETRK